MQVQLLVKSNSEPTPRDYVFQMKERVVLGRSPESAVPLEGTAISREHVALELVGDSVYAIDLSNNGTWVNGNRLKKEERVRLVSGDSLELPEYQISFHIPNRAQAPASTSEQKQSSNVKVVDPSELPPKRQGPVRHQPEASPQPEKIESKSLTLLEIWILLITLLAIGLIAYYAVLAS
jgi:predicted component of type VI protein secretion system